MKKLMTITGSIPDGCAVACSGGADSMALLHFVSRARKNVTAVHVNHGTSHSLDYESVAAGFCHRNNIKFEVHSWQGDPYEGESLEAFWRKQRIAVFNQYETVLTGHNLDDVVEWWLMTGIRGEPKLIPYQTDNRKKPFLAVSKEEILQYCARHDVPFIHDETNFTGERPRSNIRMNVVPRLLEVNPGLYKEFRKKLSRGCKSSSDSVG